MSGRSFMYHAHGLALAGSITQPFTADIAGQASTSLASTGGHSSSKNDSFNLHDIITYQSANCYVSGVKIKDSYHSAVTCVIKGLNILHIITADEIVGKLTSLAELDKKGNPVDPKISALGSRFDNLRVAGQPVDVQLNAAQLVPSDFSTLAGSVTPKTVGTQSYQWGSSTAYNAPAGLTMRAIPGTGPSGSFNATLVDAVQPTGPGVAATGTQYAYAFEVPHFGNVYFGETYVENDCRRLCMVRIELGCPYVGGATVLDMSVNGNWP